MRTIPRNRPKSSPKGDVRAMCDICGVHWPRSKLRRGEDGLLHCPDEGPGMDRVECARADAEDLRGHEDYAEPGTVSNTTGVIDL